MAAGEIYYLSATWAIVSALGVGALGAFTLVGGPARPRGAFAFGLFCLAWSLQILAGNFATLAWTAPMANVLYLVYVALLLVLPYFLIEFAVSHGPASRAMTLARAGAVLVAMTAAAVLILRPELIHGGVELRDAHFFRQRGPLEMPLVQAPFFIALGIALVALQRAVESAPTARVRQRSILLLGGLGVYAAHAAGTYAITFASFPLLGFLDAETMAWIVLFTALACLVAYLAWRNFAIAAEEGHADERAIARLAALALAVPLSLGVLEGILVLSVAPDLQLVGLWRLVGIGIIAYGIARWRVYDLPQRATRVVAGATGTAAAFATGAAAYGAGTIATSSAAVPVFAGLLVLGASILPAVNFARRLFGVSSDMPRRDLEQALYGQRIEAYRAALEASLARGTLDEDREFLEALRERFHITQDEDRLLTHLAKSSVIVARDRHAWEAYERLRLLGEGGGGRTWLGRDRARDRLVVLKEPLERWQLEPTAREAVLREARLAAKVRHPNVVAVEEVVAGKGSPVIVMEYMEGGSLADLLRARGALPWPEAKALALDMLRGVEAVHAGGIVHRDLKPSNILLSGEGVAKVADFGIAVSNGTSGKTIIMDAAASTIAGTLHYMAPEARAGAEPDKRADLYGCAAILHEMLYGAPPGLPSPVVVRKDLPATLPALLARGLAARPEARHQTARAFAEELMRVG